MEKASRRCVIVGGAQIRDYERIRGLLRENDYFIYCDCGLFHEKELGAEPDLIVGDFDSSHNPERDIETIVLPCEKDDTDTAYAAGEALKRGFEEFLLIGMTGGRFDHSLGNIGILLKLDDMNKKAVLADDLSEMEIVSGKGCEIESGIRYFSLLPVDGRVTDVDITGAKYEVKGAVFSPERAWYGVSNEVMEGGCAHVFPGSGRLLLIKVFKEQTAG